MTQNSMMYMNPNQNTSQMGMYQNMAPMQAAANGSQMYTPA